MAELELSTDPNAISVEELVIAHLAVAAASPTTASDRSDLAVETIETWRKMWPACEAVAALYGVTITQPVGVHAARRILAEAAPYLQAESWATR